MKCKTSKAALLTVWSFSSFETIARHASDESTSVGAKCFRANVLLPDPLGPMRTTKLSFGMLISIAFISINSYDQTQPFALAIRAFHQRARQAIS